jgi:uncharacterized protein (TIGR03083 family)
MNPVKPIFVVDLFPSLSQELNSVLKSLAHSDWSKPTICSLWSVKDVAAHLLGGNFSRLWSQTKVEEKPANKQLNFDDLVTLINQNNELWVQAAKRISPDLLIELLLLTDQYLYDHFKKLDPFDMAGITVAWASDQLPPNWLDIAREFTEKWLHQQHIREAVGFPLLTEKKWLDPVLDIFMRALPYAYRLIDSEIDTSINIRITGEAGDDWTLRKGDLGWELFTGADANAKAFIQLDQNWAWRLFTKGISMDKAKFYANTSGDVGLCEIFFKVVSIMA